MVAEKSERNMMLFSRFRLTGSSEMRKFCFEVTKGWLTQIGIGKVRSF